LGVIQQTHLSLDSKLATKQVVQFHFLSFDVCLTKKLVDSVDDFSVIICGDDDVTD